MQTALAQGIGKPFDGRFVVERREQSTSNAGARSVLPELTTTELLPTVPGHIPPGNHGNPVTTPALTLSQLEAAVGGYIVDTYHQRVHPETGQAPAARWAAGDWLPRMPDSLEALDLLLLTMATPRKVQRDGIHCHGLRYFSLATAPRAPRSS